MRKIEMRIVNLVKDAPKEIYRRSKDRSYKLIKQYPYYWLYEDQFGFKECFRADELGLLEDKKTVKFKWGKAESLWDYE